MNFDKGSPASFRRFHDRRRGQRITGFSLLELMIVLAVVATLLSLGVPSLIAAINSMKLTTVSNAFISHLHLARSEAIKHNTRVVICKSSDGEACSSQGGWEQGWMVFQDANNSGLRESAEPVITHERALGAQLRMSGNLNVTRYISFTPAGSAVLTGGGFQAGTLTICNSSVDAAEARQIVLNAVGRARVQRKLVNSCI